MRNVAGMDPVELGVVLAQELQAANIPIVQQDGMGHPEVKTMVGGELQGWSFRRNWYYWVVSTKTNLIPCMVAQGFHEGMGGKHKVRVDGHCGEPSPADWWGKHGHDADHYHIDTAEGLKLFASFLQGSGWDSITPSEEASAEATRLAESGYYIIENRAHTVAKWPMMHPPDLAKRQITAGMWDESEVSVVGGDYLRLGALGDLLLEKDTEKHQRVSRYVFKAFLELGGNTFDKALYGPALDYKEVE